MDIIWLISAFFSGLIATKLKLPPLIGYLCAGFFLHAIDVSHAPLLEHLAELGIQLLLFTIGLKLDVKALLKPRVWAGTLTHSLLFMTASLIALKAFAWLGIAFFTDLDFTSSLVVVFALSFSSTVCVVKLLEEKGEIKSRHGQLSLGILIMQDIIAVLFLTFSSGKTPSIAALGLIFLPIFSPVLRRLLSHSGHQELLPLAGFFLALAGGALFKLVGLKADLGALVFGILLSRDVKAAELAKAMLSFKDVFLIGFFMSIGFSALPTLEMFGIATLLAFLLLAKGFLLFIILTRFRLRARTAWLSVVALTNYSEFGLIVAQLAKNNGWLSAEWLVILALSLSISFVFAAIANAVSHKLYTRYKPTLKKFESSRVVTAPPIDTNHVDILIVGMGRVGTGAYHAFKQNHDHRLLGIDSSENKVKQLQKQQINAVYGDSEDSDFWEGLDLSKVKIIMLALPTLQDLLESITQIKKVGFTGEIAAVTHYNDEKAQLESLGVDAVFNFYAEAGSGFARHALTNLKQFAAHRVES